MHTFMYYACFTRKKRKNPIDNIKEKFIGQSKVSNEKITTLRNRQHFPFNLYLFSSFRYSQFIQN
jgi:hypothetical protein